MRIQKRERKEAKNNKKRRGKTKRKQNMRGIKEKSKKETTRNSERCRTREQK